MALLSNHLITAISGYLSTCLGSSTQATAALCKHCVWTAYNSKLTATCLDLALAWRAMRRLVHRQQHHLIVAGQHLAVEPTVNGADILIRELSEVVEACR